MFSKVIEFIILLSSAVERSKEKNMLPFLSVLYVSKVFWLHFYFIIFDSGIYVFIFENMRVYSLSPKIYFTF